MGKIASGVKCNVHGCEKPAVRSISQADARIAGADTTESRRAYLCREHYKELKKKRRNDKKLEKWRHMAY